jgi:periplasmic divalent cation tolerance protein
VRVVLVTVPSEEVGAALARTLVEERLIACANVLPQLRSIYRWGDSVHDEREVLLLLKTAARNFEALRQRIVSLHPYDVPEVISLELTEGHRPYLDWVLSSVT